MARGPVRAPIPSRTRTLQLPKQLPRTPAPRFGLRTITRARKNTHPRTRRVSLIPTRTRRRLYAGKYKVHDVTYPMKLFALDWRRRAKTTISVSSRGSCDAIYFLSSVKATLPTGGRLLNPLPDLAVCVKLAIYL